MLKGFINMLVKELKELMRDPKIFLGMIVIPLIMFPLLGGIIGFSMQTAQESAQRAVVLVVNHDSGPNSTQFISYLNSSLNVIRIDVTTPVNVSVLMNQYNATDAVEIPSDFSENVTSKQPVAVNFYSVFTGSGILETVTPSTIDALVEQYNRYLAPDVVVPEKSVIIKGTIVEGVDPRLLSNLMISQAIAMPITMIILLSYSMQIAATSVAMEKEEKTLETLLTLPMDRFSILMGKLSGSIVVAGVGAVAYMIGFNFYMGSFTGAIPAGTSVDLASLGLVPSLFGYLLVGISLFVTLLSALALAVIVSAFVEDVRNAQSLIGYIYPFVFIPSLALIYLDLNSLPFWLRLVFYAIPFSHPIIASKAVVMGDYLTAIIGIVYVAAFTLVVMYVASRLFATEKILTAKLKVRGLRRREKPPAEGLE